VPVHDPGCGEAVLQRSRVELRIPTRAGEAADVDERLDTCAREHLDELVQRSRTVADGMDDHAGHR
jgi:hypothetical protein